MASHRSGTVRAAHALLGAQPGSRRTLPRARNAPYAFLTMNEARRYAGSMTARTWMTFLPLVSILLTAPDARAFSVLAHQAVVDQSWDATLAPAIVRRFPGADLQRARVLGADPTVVSHSIALVQLSRGEVRRRP